MIAMLEWILEYWLQIVFTAIVSIVTWSVKRIATKVSIEHQEQIQLRNGLLALLRSNIITEYNHYIDKHYVPIYAMESIEAAYQAYHDLGGNGTVTKLYKELKALPSNRAQGGNSCLNSK